MRTVNTPFFRAPPVSTPTMTESGLIMFEFGSAPMRA